MSGSLILNNLAVCSKLLFQGFCVCADVDFFRLPHKMKIIKHWVIYDSAAVNSLNLLEWMLPTKNMFLIVLRECWPPHYTTPHYTTPHHTISGEKERTDTHRDASYCGSV
mmetsp:Transcript_22074/g.36482  ORF Transcript_22074/g.36482 Transcript_22074/m.36482 type:complete len:110 (-) Transcript_22074:64-393(-)